MTVYGALKLAALGCALGSFFAMKNENYGGWLTLLHIEIVLLWLMDLAKRRTTP